MNSSSKIRCLLTLRLSKISGQEIGDLRSKQLVPRHTERFLPKYTLNDNGNIIDSHGYLQFVNDGDQEFYVFDIINIEEPLNEEISNSGIDNIMKNLLPVFDKLNPIKYKDLFETLRPSEHLVFDMTYDTYTDHEGVRDYDLDIEIYGYLDEKKNLVKLDERKDFFRYDNTCKESHREECLRIQQMLIKKGFLSCGIGNAESLWYEFSDRNAAGFLGVPDEDDEIYDCIKDQLPN